MANISPHQRKQQGAVFTTLSSHLVVLERELGYTSEPTAPPYWEDSAGGGDLVVELADAMFSDLADAIPNAQERLSHIFNDRIYMNDIDEEFIKRLEKRLVEYVKTSGGSMDDIKFNISLANTIDPDFDPSTHWGFDTYRTITNRSYQQLSDLDDVEFRTKTRQFYQSKVFPNNAGSGKRMKVTDCGQYKAISDSKWLGGTDVRPSNVPLSLMTDDIYTIDFSTATKNMFKTAKSGQQAGIEVVVLCYDVTPHNIFTVKHGDSDVSEFTTADEAWTFYISLTTHDFSNSDSTAVYEHICQQFAHTISDYCSIHTSGITTGNKKMLVGDLDWMESLIEQGIEREAFVGWLGVGNIVPGQITTTQFCLAPYSTHTKAMEYFLKQVPAESSHAVPAEKKALPSWQRATGLNLYSRYNVQFDLGGVGGVVGSSDGFVGIGQTGSITRLQPKPGVTRDQMLMLLVFLNSDLGNFLKAMVGKQHKAVANVIALGASIGKIPTPNLQTIKDGDMLVEFGAHINNNNKVCQSTEVVYSIFDVVDKSQQQIIRSYLDSRTPT